MWFVPVMETVVLWSLFLRGAWSFKAQFRRATPAHGILAAMADFWWISSISGYRSERDQIHQAMVYRYRSTTTVVEATRLISWAALPCNIEPPCHSNLIHLWCLINGMATSTRYVVVVTSNHDTGPPCLRNEFIEFQRNIDTAHAIQNMSW